MFTCEVISSENRKRKIACSSCGISYSARDYGLLYAGRKIVYFKHKNKISCHECLYRLIAIEAKGKKMIFNVITEDYLFKCSYESDGSVNDGDAPFSELF